MTFWLPSPSWFSVLTQFILVMHRNRLKASTGKMTWHSKSIRGLQIPQWPCSWESKFSFHPLHLSCWDMLRGAKRFIFYFCLKIIALLLSQANYYFNALFALDIVTLPKMMGQCCISLLPLSATDETLLNDNFLMFSFSFHLFVFFHHKWFKINHRLES